MSYTRRYSEVVSKTVTVNYSYPASQNGGSSSKTVTVDIPVSWDVHVDTNPFDQSISEANAHVNVLTGTVVATEAAQIQAKINSAEQISDSIIDGFFGLIKSEINQQITEIRPRVEALLVELVHHQQTCLSKKDQMERDFQRIAERYAKIFLDLDKELRNRIVSLNKDTINAHSQISNQVHKTFADISTGISTVYNKEASTLQSILYSTGLKNRALAMIESSKKYLFSEKNLAKHLKEILVPVNTSTLSQRYIPVLFFETRAKAFESIVISSRELTEMNSGATKSSLKNSFINEPWIALSVEARQQIETYFKLELNKKQEHSNKEMDSRLASEILRLWQNDRTIKCNG
jgi:hypothetical protein